MDYFGILKRAYKIAVRHRYLWIFGILVGSAGSSFNVSLPNSSDFENKFNDFFNGSMPMVGNNFWLNYWSVIAWLIGIITVIGLVWFIFSIISRGSLLGSVEAIEKGRPDNFRIGFVYGWHKFWRVLAVALMLFLIILISIIVLVLPIVLFVIAKIYVLAALYGFVFFLADLLLWLYLGIMSPYIQRLAVLGNRGAWHALATSWDFFKKHFKEILVMYLLLIAAGILIGVGMLLALLVIGGLLFAIGFGLYLASMAVFWVYVGVFGLAFIIFFLILGGVINTFKSSVLTLTYLELAKKA